MYIYIVWEVKFHPSYPNHLFTCSQDGGLWHWDVNRGKSTTTSLGQLTTDLLPSQLSFTSSQQPYKHSDPHPLRHAKRHVKSKAVPTTASVKPPLQGTPLGHVTEGAEKATQPSYANPWLFGAVKRSDLDIQDYSPSQGLSVNSLDIESKHLVCGTDKEALFVVPNLTLT